MAKNIKVLVNTGNEETNKTFDIPAGSGKAGKPVRIKAVKGARYHLEDPAAKNVGPENIRSKRVGKNLHVMVDGGTEADLIIEGYYDEAMLTENNRGLYGRAEDGKLYEYIPEDPTPAGMPINLADGGKPVSQVLGGGQVGEEFALSGLVVAAAGFNALGVGAAAVGAAAVAGGGGGGGGAAVVPVTPVPSGQTGALADISDSGTKGDNITNVKNPTISGRATAGATVEVILTDANGNVVPGGPFTTTADANGNYSVVVGPNGGLPDGKYTQQIRVTNSGGSSSVGGTPFEIDATPPTTTAAVTEITDNIGAAQGPVASGGITDDTQLNLKGTLSAPLAAGETIQIFDGNTFLGTATVGPNNTWTFADTRTLVNGTNVSYTARVADTANNQGTAGTPYTATIDTTVPTLSINSVAGDTVTDAGNGTYDATERGSNANSVATKPVISGTSTFAVGKTVSVTLNIQGADVTKTATVQSGGTWSVELTDAEAVKLNHGNTYAIKASVVNDAGVVATDVNNNVVINTAQPDVPTVLNNNSGTTTPVVSGIAQKQDPSNAGQFIALEAGDTISVTLNGVTVTGTIGSLPTGLTYNAATKTWSLDTATANGSTGFGLTNNSTHDVGVSITSGISQANPSGITKADTSSGELVINTTAPTITLNTISGGFINNAEKEQDLVISGTTNAQVGSIVTITGLDGTSRTAQVIAGSAGNNTFSLTISGADVKNFTGTDVTKTVQASVVNAFNLSGTDTENVVIDTAAPSNTAVTLDLISGDGLLTPSEIAGTVKITGKVTGEFTPGDMVTIEVNGKKFSGAVAPDGTFSVDVPGSDLNADTAKNVKVSLVATDAAGNSATFTDDQTYAIDTNTSADKTALVVDPISSDNILPSTATGNIAVTGKATGAFAAGDTVTLTVNNKPFTGTVAANGTFSINVPAADLLADTDTQLEARIAATTPNGTQTATAAQDYVIETSSNTGLVTALQLDPVTADNIINNAENTGNIAITGKATGKFSAGDTVTLKVNNTTVTGTVVADGTFSINVAASALVADADTQLEASITGTGGTAATAVQNYAVDTTAPTTTVNITAISLDTGVSNTDFITNDNNGLTVSATLSVALKSDEKLFYSKDNGVTWTDITASVSGTNVSHIDSTLTSTTTIRMRVQDVAGNAGTADTQLVTIDTDGGNNSNGSGGTATDPNATSSTVVSITAISTDSGVSTADFITSDQTLSYSGTVSGFTANGAAVQLVLTNASGTEVGRTFVTPDANGNWTWDNTSVTRDSGNYTLTATLVDAAGNTITNAVADSQVVTVDNSATQNTDNGSGTATPQTDNNKDATVSITAISTDSGVSTSDFITSDQTLSYSGTVSGFTANGAAVQLVLTNASGAEVGRTFVTPDANGNWTWDNTSVSRASGNYTLTATIVDAAGNRTNTAAAGTDSQVVTVDNSATQNTDNGSGTATPQTDPNTTATASIDAISTDSGTSATDFITNDNTLVVSGQTSLANTGAAAGDQLLVEIKNNAGTVVATQFVKPDSAGNWTMNNQANSLADGKYTIAVHIVDLAGNKVKADADTQTLIIDTNQGGTDAGSNTDSSNGNAVVDPNTTNAISISGITTDTGFSTSDFITADGTLVISGTSTLDTSAGGAGDQVRVQLVDATGKVVGEKYIAATGAWSFDNTANNLTDGNYTIKAAIVDAAGNIVKAAADQPLVISSTAAPTNATVGISSISTDTGTSVVDFVTQDSTLVFNGTVNNFDSAVHKVLVQIIKVSDNSVVTSGDATVTNGTWTLDKTGVTLADGQYTIRAVLTNFAGIEIASTVATQALVVDNAGNSNPANSPNNTDPNTAAVLSFTTIQDAANDSFDTGSSASDYITSDNTLLIKGAVTSFSSTGGGAGDKVRVQIVDSTNTVVAQQFVSVDANGKWAFDNKAIALADGKYTLKAIVVDAAGNTVTTEVTQALVIDTNQGGMDNSSNPGNSPSTDNNSGASVAVAITGITTDTGFSATDFITSDGTLTISGTTTNFVNTAGSAGDKVRVQVINALGNVVAETYTDPASGNWSFNNQANTLTDGNYTLKAAIVDAAGNVVKAAVDQPLVINSGNTPTNATLAISSISDDTGVSASDFVTSDNTLTITGTTTGFASGSTDKILVQILNGSTVVSSGFVTPSNGAWTFNHTSTGTGGVNTATLADGKYTIRAVYTTAAGVENSQPVTQNLVVDRSGSNNPNNNPAVDPNSGSTVAVSITGISDDTGTSATDLITSDQTLVIRGNTTNFTSANGGDGDVVRVQIVNTSGTDGNRTAFVNVDANGNWSLDNIANTLAAGTYTLKADIVDAAGNLVKAGTDRTLVIQTAIDPNNNPNSAAVVAITAITDDTGADASDFITNDNTLSYSGTLSGYTATGNADKVMVELLAADGTTVVATGFATPASNGNWTWAYQTLQADGKYTARATLVNAAGQRVNTGASGQATQDVIIDTDGAKEQPSGSTDANASATVAITAISTDSGVSTSDFITADTTLSYSGTVTGFTANGSAVKLELKDSTGAVLATDFVTPSNGAWTWDNTGATRVSGNYTLTATIVDAAGNRINTAAGGTADQIVTIDNDGSKNTDNSNGSATPQTDANTSATVTIDAISDDTGVSANDFITQDTGLVYNGSVSGFTANGDVVKLELKDSTGAALETVFVSVTNNAWTWTDTNTNRTSGNYTLVATVVDKAGNRVNTAAAGQDTQIVTIDNQGDKNTDNSNGNATPQTDNNSANASVDIVSITEDTGSSTSDFVTADAQLSISGTVTGFSSTGNSAGDQVLVQIKNNAGAVVATQFVKPDSNGNWTMNNQVNTLADGKYTITADIVDLAGNTVKAGDTQALIIDTNKGGTDASSNTNSGTGAAETDPNAGGTVSVSISGITSDTGFSNADFITADGTLVISGAVANFSNSGAAAGDQVRVQIVDAAGKLVAEKYVDPAANAWSFDNTANTLADGNYTLKAAIVDKAGNIIKAAADQALVISNTAAPTTATVAISAITDDTGISGVDFITADNTLIFSGTTNGFDSNTHKVRVQILSGNTVQAEGAATVDGTGKWTFDPTTVGNTVTAASLADGSYSIRAVLTNLTGTAEVAGTAVTQKLVVDTAAGSNPDNGSGSNGTDANTSATVSITAISQDTGSSTSDFVTSDNSLLISGTTSGFARTGGSAGDKVRVQIFDNAGDLKATQFVTPDANGLWAMDNTSANLADGKYNIKAVIVDVAGNLVNTEVTQALIVDTNKGGTEAGSNTNSGTGAAETDPNAGGTVAVAIGGITTDSGFSATDFITNDNTLSFTGTVANFSSTGAAAGDTVRVQVVNAAGTVVAEKYVTPTGANGTWAFDNTAATLADGNYTIKAAIVDKAGNVVKAAVDQLLVINTGNTPTTATLAISSITTDTGTSASDFITSDNTLTINGTTDGLASGSTDKVFVQILSGTTVVSSGFATLATGNNPSWTFNANAATNTSGQASLADGKYTIRAVYTNAAGTTISQPVTHNLAIDTGAANNPDNSPSTDPNASVTLTIDAISLDSGTSSNDFVTNDNTLVISGSAPGFTNSNGGAGDIVRVQIFNQAGTTLLHETTVTVDTNGKWAWDRTATAGLADGQYTLKASILDAAGNTVTTATNKTLIIDSDAGGNKVDQPSGTTDVNANATITIGGISQDTGTSTSDFITQDGTLVFNGTTGSFNAANGSKVHLVVVDSAGKTVVDQYLDVTNNTWTFDNTTQGTLADGAYTIKATIVDKAGNTVVAATEKTLVIDTNKGGTDAGSNPANNGTDSNAGNTVTVSVTSIDDGLSTTGNDNGSKDNGTSSSDFVTNDNTLVIKGTTANFSSTGGANGDRVRVQLLDEAGTTVIAETYLLPDSNGAWSWDRTATTQADGKYKLKADIVDAAGNVVKAGNTQDHTIDTSATNNPNNGSGAAGTDSNATSTLTLAITSIVDSGANDSKDTGASATDFVTNDQTLVIKGTAVGFSNTGAQAGDELRIQIVKADGTIVRSAFVTVDGSGNWTLDNHNNTLDAGTYTVKADVVDLAGNIVKSATRPLTIDTTNTQDVTALQINKDTVSSSGVSNTDWKLLSDGASKGQTIFGTIGTGETLSKAEISIDAGATWIAGDINADLVKFYLGGALSTGTKTFQYRTTDVAGNTSAVTTKDLVVEALATATTSDVTVATSGATVTLPTATQANAFAGTSGDETFVLDADTIANYLVDATPGVKWVHAAAGVDTLRINGEGTTLNLNNLTTEYTNTKLQGFEIIDMASDTGAQTLIANATSLASMATAGWLTNTNLSGNYQLVVRGNVGDKLVLSAGDGYDTSGWVMGDTNLPFSTAAGGDDGRTYTRWFNAALKIDLLVDVNVSTSNKFVSFTGISTDTGSSATDLITTDQTLSLNGAVTGLSAGDVVKVTVINSSNTKVVDGATATLNGDGTWTLNNQSNTLALGNYTVKVAVFTSAGGSAVANAQDRIVQVIAANDAPVNTGLAALSTNEDTALAITGLSVADASNNGDSYTVTLGVTNGVLNVSGGSATIAGSGTNSVTLTGTKTAINATLAATVSYVPTANFNGSAQLTMTTNDASLGDAKTDADTVTITVNSVNDAPVVTPSATARSYTENAAGVDANDTLTLSDIDSANLTGATVQITSGLTTGDVLSFTNANGISGSYDAATGKLTLSGTATVAQYQDALRSVMYSSNSDNPTATSASRTISWQVNDGQSANSASNVGTSTINLTAVNDAPVAVANTASATEAGGTANATAGTNPTGNVVTNDTDVDNANSTLTVKDIKAGTAAGAGTAVTASTTSADGTSIAGSFGTIKIGADGSYVYTVDNANANVQALNTSSTALSDVFTYTVQDTAGLTSTATITVSVAGANDAPIVANAIADTTGTEGTAFSYVVPANAFSDVDNSSLTLTATLADGSALPSWLSFNASTRTFSGDAPANSAGSTVSVKVTASDGSLSISDDFDIAIGAANAAPVANPTVANPNGIDQASTPEVVITDNQSAARVANGTEVTFTLKFSEAINASTLTASDIAVTNGALVANSLTKVNDTTWTVKATAAATGNAGMALSIADGAYTSAGGVAGIGNAAIQIYGSDLTTGGPAINGTVGINTAPTGWTVASSTPDTNDYSNSAWVNAGLGGYSIADINGTSLNGGQFVELLSSPANGGEAITSALTNLVVGQRYVYGVQWQQASLSGSSFSAAGGSLILTVGGISTTFSSADVTDGWQTALVAFEATASSMVIEGRINVRANANGMIVMDSLTTAQIQAAITAGTVPSALDTSNVITTITGTTGADTLIGTDNADNVTAGGGADTILTGAGNDTVTVNGSTQTALAATNNTMLIDGGTGINQLINNSGGGSIDLTNPVISAKLRNFSSFDINGTANNTLKLGVQTVSTISGATDNAATTLVDESKMVVVNGSAGDIVQLVDKSAWSASAAQSGAILAATYGSAFKFVSGRSYVEYSRNGATLFVDSTVTVNTTTTSATSAMTTGQAVSVQTLFGPSFTDVDSGQTFKGVAITNAGSSTDVSGKGKYQISSNGTTWTDLASDLTDATAIFAAPDALIRFVGAAGVEALAPQNLTVRLIDSSELTGTSGITAGTITTGNTIDASVNGGSTAFSGNLVTLQPSVNTAPVSTDADGIVAGDPFGAVIAGLNTVVLNPNGTNQGSTTFGSTTVTVSGNTGTRSIDLAETDNFFYWLGDQNTDETMNMVFDKPISKVELDFGVINNNSATVFETISFIVNGQKLALTPSMFTSFTKTADGTAATPVISADGFSFTGPTSALTSYAAKITLDAALLPGGLINSLSIVEDVTGSNPNGVGVKVKLTDASATAAQTVAQLFGSVYSDVNNDAMQGVVITSAGATGNTLGKYQWSSNGTTWTDLPAGLTDGTSKYLAKTDLIRFVPSSTNGSGVAKPALTARLVDDSQASGTLVSGATVDAAGTKNGGTTAISGNTVGYAQVDNTAPVLADISVGLNSVPSSAAPANPTGAVGTLVSDLVGGVTDANSFDGKGIAISAIDTSKGSLFFSTNGGTTWTAVDTGTALSDSRAFLLKADADNRVYFKPNANFTGSISSAFTFHAWDQTSGTEGTFVNISAANAKGGTTAFSVATDAVNQTVTTSQVVIVTTTAISGETLGDRAGFSVSSAGDVNGDGYDDVIIGADQADPTGATDGGKAYVVFGGATNVMPLNLSELTVSGNSKGFVINGQSASDAVGKSVSYAGDLNGDGFADLIVGGPGVNSNAGRAYVVYGKTNTTAVNLSSIAAGNGGFAINSEAGAGSVTGRSVTLAGDVNGDGIADLLVSGQGANSSAGRSYLVFGKTDNSAINLADIVTGVGGFVINRQVVSDSSGASVSNAGDVNGDGLADLIIGAPFSDPAGGTSAGRAYVVYGKTGTAAVSFADVANGTGGFAINGQAGSDFAGFSVSTAGDVNGDGLADLLVGAPANSKAASAGQAYVVFGISGNTAIDLSALAAGNGGFVIKGETNLDGAGMSVSTAGDLNGDGFADIIVGTNNAGKAYVVFGKSGTTAIDLSAVVSGSGGFVINTNSTDSNVVSNAGDVNGDGYDDLIVGRYPVNSNTGQSYVIYGGPQFITGNVATATGSVADELVIGTSGADTLTGGGGVDRFSAGKGDDTIVLSASDVTNLAATTGANRAYVDGGNGIDTLQVSASGVNLDLTAITNVSASAYDGSSRINDIERINLGTDSTANTLTLAARDVNDMAGFNSFNTGNGWTNVGAGTALSATSKFHQLVVDGTSSDVLNLQAGQGYWTNAGQVSNAGNTYTVYQNAGTNTQVLVDSDIAVNNNDSTPAGEAVIDLGANGKLIAPVQVEGKWYYYWDLSGDGTSADQGSLNGGTDFINHDALDGIFKYDANGVLNPAAGTDTTDIYRYATINGVKVALPTANGGMAFPAGINGPQPGTTANSQGTTNNSTYDELLAIWDNHNGTGTTVVTQNDGTPDGWAQAHYWSSTPSTTGSGHIYVGLITGDASNIEDRFFRAVALQVLPVVVDLNRDGIIGYGQVTMDVNGDGALDVTKWAGAADGVLVWDKFADGLVHNNSQYAFAQYATTYRLDAQGHARAATDLEGLADAFDSNHDGVFNAADAQFAEFKVWQDADQDGVSDAGEVRSLADLGITSIDLTSDGVTRTPVAGVTEAGQSTAQLADGSSVLVADAAFEFRAATAAEAASHTVAQGENVFRLFGGTSLDLSAVTGAAQLSEVNASADTAANTIKLTLADVLGAADSNDTAVLTPNEWTAANTTVTDHGHDNTVYNATSSAAAQLLIDQHMLVTQHG